MPPSATLAQEKTVDLNPTSAPTPAPAPAPAPAATAGTSEKKVETGGMSATSGPLDDGIAHGFGGEEAGAAGVGDGKTALGREGGA